MPGLFVEMGLTKFLLWLNSSLNPDHCLWRGWDYRHESPHLAIMHFNENWSMGYRFCKDRKMTIAATT
jgi:hypothetical protein